jgi:hypothetical protein
MGSLTVHVFDYQQKPVEGRKVYCDFIGRVSGMFDTHGEEYTDDEGIAEFHDVPVGTVEVYVDGEKQLEVSVGQNDYEDVTVTI